MSAEKTTKILHVEDDRSLQKLVRVTLERLGGYAVRSAADGYEAVEFARAATPDLLVLDLDLPGMDGAATLAALREISALREVPAVFLTAANDPEVKARLFSLGAADVLSKPFRPRELLQAIDRALKRA